VSVAGVDVYRGQGRVDWRRVAASGQTFAFCKATEGTTVTDPQFAANWAGIRIVGMTRGAYHYARPGNPAAADASHFLGVLRSAGGTREGDLLALDLEDAGGRPPATLLTWAREWVGQVGRATGRPVLLYTSPAFWRERVGDPPSFPTPLWIAHFGVPAPDVPRAWRAWSFWQYGETGRVPGIAGDCDVDRFNGTRDQLRAFSQGGTMATTDDVLARLNDVYRLLAVGDAADSAGDPGTHPNNLERVRATVEATAAKVDQLSTPTVDVAALAAQLAPLVAAQLSAQLANSVATAVADLLATRLRS
jgi:GH25 family lysozyme M1 (1,4-beta-N-acetylmuramidase)